MIEKQVKWWGEKKDWGRIEGTKEAEITSVKILDISGIETNSFKLGDTIIVKTEFLVREEVKEPHFGVAVFREDALYCYGPNSLFDGHIIDRLDVKKDKSWFSIEFRDVPLMPGRYFLSVAIWDKKEFMPYSFHIGAYSFAIRGLNSERQLLFLPYIWRAGRHRRFRFKKDIKFMDIDRLRNKWGHKFKSKKTKARIVSLNLVDTEGLSANCFNTNEKMKINLQLNPHNHWSPHFIWVGIFRSDGVYCFGTKERLAKDEKEVSVTYPRLQLLDGTYYVSVGIWKLGRIEPLICHHGIYPFNIKSDKKDHGTVYIDHKWEWRL